MTDTHNLRTLAQHMREQGLVLVPDPANLREYAMELGIEEWFNVAHGTHGAGLEAMLAFHLGN